MRQFLSELLVSEGYTVLLAEDGQDAVNKYSENIDSMDLVLINIMMSRKDGVTAKINMIDLNPDAKILMMTGYSAVNQGDI